MTDLSKHIAKAKKAKQEIKDTICGYLRQEFNMETPELIEIWCIAYYNFYDEFDPENLHSGIQLIGNTITLLDIEDGSGSSSYLKETVRSGKSEWKFKIERQGGDGRSWCSTIGLYKMNNKVDTKKNLSKNIFVKGCAGGYAYGCGKSIPFGKDCSKYYTGDDVKYGVKCKEGDIITMILDMNELQLRYQVNGIDQGTIFNVEAHREYKAVVNLSRINDSVSLV